MKKQYKIQLPKGKAVVTVKTNVDNDNGVMTMDVDFCDTFIMPPIPPKYEPKDGDFVCYYGESGSKNVAIFKEKLSRGSRIYCVYNTCGKYHFCTNIIDECIMRPATEEEKKLLIDKLAERGKKWNPETKRIEDVRWRAVLSGLYYIVDTDFFIREMEEKGERTDCALYDAGNYFRTREAAEKTADQIREILKKSKAE